MVAGVAIAATLLILPVCQHEVGLSTSFLPAVLGIVACFDVISVVVLAADYLDSGDRRLLATAGAFVWSLILMGGYTLSFPGVIPHDPLASTPSVAPWLWAGWHVGFPVLLGAAWAPWPERPPRGSTRRHRHVALYLVTSIVAVVSLGVVAFVVDFADRLPVLINGLDTGGLTVVTAPVALPLVMLAIWAIWHGNRRRVGPERWVVVAAAVCLCDLVLIYVAHYRYTVGWYAGRGLTLLGAGLVMITMYTEFRRLKGSAELLAATDQLTGLANRRTVMDALAAVLARAGRAAGTTSVLMLDLDGFKAVNDRDGHHGGDLLLQAAAAAWSSQLRAGDLLARVGGDEFLAVLADTDETQARVLATRLLNATPTAVRVSIGLAVARGDRDVPALVAAADQDMYRNKMAGRHPTATPPAAGDGRARPAVRAVPPVMTAEGRGAPRPPAADDATAPDGRGIDPREGPMTWVVERAAVDAGA